MKSKIAFFDAKPYDQEFFNQQNKEFNFEIKYFTSHLNADTAEMTKGYDAVCAFVNDELSRPVLEKLHEYGIKIVALRSAGYNNVDLSAAFEKIHIVRVPAYSPYAVAEHALALILTLNRKTHKAYNRTRDNNFNINGLLGFDIHGKTIGVIGTGKIGQVFIEVMSGFGVKIIAYDPFPNPQLAAKLKFSYVDLDTLYRESDIISLHCPLTKETTHLIDAKAFSKMRSGVMLINTSRGALVDTTALISALKSKKLAAAGLDVYEEESEYFFEDLSGEILDDDTLARLLSFNNVLITSHQAFFTKEAMQNIARTTLNNLKIYWEKGQLENEICYHCGQKSDNCQRIKTGKCF